MKNIIGNYVNASKTNDTDFIYQESYSSNYKEQEIEENILLIKELNFTLKDIKSLSPYERKVYLEKINNFKSGKQVL
ncbi:MAG: hypothetical protein ACOCVF_03250 [bacterium]